MRILVLAAHPDDELLGVGGTVAWHVTKGDEVQVVIAADCMSARRGGESRLPEATLRAAKILGTSPAFLGLAGMTLSPDLALNRIIEGIVRDARPDVVYTHHAGDPNSDHRAVALATMIATRPMGDFPRRVLSFETPSSTEWGWAQDFRPTYFIDVTATIDRKLEAMACYGAELREPPHPRGIEALRTRAAYWGQVAGCAYAEPFMLMREVVR